jgi:hypothetical protein
MQQQRYPLEHGTHMNIWSRFIIISMLLLLASSSVVFATLETVQAVKNFQQHHVLAKKEDVRIISSWMTISYVSRTYHVPENYLCRSLRVPISPAAKHTTLYDISMRSHRQVNEVIKSTQAAITDYRKHHTTHQAPTRHNPPHTVIIGA